MRNVSDDHYQEKPSRNVQIQVQWRMGMRQMAIARCHKISATRVRHILKRVFKEVQQGHTWRMTRIRRDAP